MMESTTKGVLAIWHDIEEAHQDEVLHWYNKQHHLERLGIPGFMSVRRYESIQGTSQVFIFYRTTRPEVLTSQDYLDRVNNPTSWTQKCMPRFRNNSRTVCQKIAHSGIGDGGVVATIRFAPRSERMLDVRHSLAEDLLPRVAAQTGMCSAELWEADLASTHIHSKEREIRSSPDRFIGWVAMLSGTRLDVVQQQAEFFLATIDADGAEATKADLGLYRLTFALEPHDFHNVV